MWRNLPLEGGLRLAYWRDPKGNDVGAYPYLKAKHTVVPGVVFQGGIRGDVVWYSLQDIYQENPWMVLSSTPRPTGQILEVYGSARGTVARQVGWHTGSSMGRYKNFPGWREDDGHQRLCLQYSSIFLGKFFGELTYNDAAEDWSVRVRAERFFYAEKQCFRPRYQYRLHSTYHFQDKIILQGAFCWMGGIPLPAQQETQLIDLYTEANYWWNNRFSLFAKLQHLYNKDHVPYASRSAPNGWSMAAGVVYAW